MSHRNASVLGGRFHKYDEEAVPEIDVDRASKSLMSQGVIPKSSYVTKEVAVASSGRCRAGGGDKCPAFGWCVRPEEQSATSSGQAV